MKTDLHMHGPIGFQPYWLQIQGYMGENLLKLIVDECLKKEIDICGITSEETEIPKGSIHDRFTQLFSNAQLPTGYKSDKLEDVALVVEKENRRVIIVNTQTVAVKNSDGKRYDHLIVGSNKVPNGKSLEDTIKYSQDKDLIQIAEHPFITYHFGVGRDLLEKHLNDYDAIEIHNAQLPAILQNRKVTKFAKQHDKPGIASSDAHRIEDLGTAYTELDFIPDLSSGEKFLTSLRNAIRSTDPQNPHIHKGYVTFGFIDWYLKFRTGLKNREKKAI